MCVTTETRPLDRLGHSCVPIHVCRAGAFTLVCVLPNEPKLRFFNFETRSNYIIPLTPESNGAAGEALLQPPTVTALQYDARGHVLAAALSNGAVQCFQHMHEGRCAPSAEASTKKERRKDVRVI